MKRTFGLKKKRKKRGDWVLDTVLECIDFIEILIVLPFRILFFFVRSIVKNIGDLFHF